MIRKVRRATNEAALAEGLRAFVASAVTTLRETLGLEAEVDLHAPVDLLPRVVVTVNVTGDLRGVAWVFPVELARELARRMAGESNPELDGMAAEELANILTGRAVGSLGDHGIEIQVEPPHVASAVEPGIRARITTTLGVVEIVFYLQRAPIDVSLQHSVS